MVRHQIRGIRRLTPNGTRSTFDFLADRFRRAAHEAADAYSRAGVRHALIGGIAVGAYTEPRATKDIDYLVGDEAFDVQGPIISFRPGIPLQVYDTAIDTIPIPAGHHDVLEAAINTAVTSDEGIPIIRPEYLAYTKLLSSRARDHQDVVALLRFGLDAASVERLLTAKPDLQARFARAIDASATEDEE